MSVKELQVRCRLLTERLSESAHIIDHDPSLALYRLQEHVGKSLPVLVNRKYVMNQLNTCLHGACFDLDNAVSALNSIKVSSDLFDNILKMLKNYVHCKQQKDHRQVSKRFVCMHK
ncbi:hypothetical protein AB6A40_008205 [Gnathostoma spinigerum]|uniref:Uncharacterized protein n=1 Tax=Gnathostoma spinigerum TaxID=75299 RepID=A0ABD6EQC6_9BILA